jgi:hypothetical protein
LKHKLLQQSVVVQKRYNPHKRKDTDLINIDGREVVFGQFKTRFLEDLAAKQT